MNPLARLSRRTYRRHPGQTLLSVLGIALGVAVVLAIDLTTISAERAFVMAADSVTGSATHEIVGGAAGVEEQLYAELRLEHGLRDAAPIVTGDVRLLRDGQREQSLTLLGVDPFAEAPLRPYFAFNSEEVGSDFDLSAFLTVPGSFACTERLAGQLGWSLGETLQIEAQGRRSQLQLVSFLAPRDPVTAQGLDRVLVADIATAQECLGRIGRLDRIDLVLEGDDAPALRSWLPATVDLRLVDDRRVALGELTRAFRLNLQALSLLTLLVGGFLIFSTVSFTVVRRRRSLGILRAIGTTRRQLFRMVVTEALALGIIGTLVGVALGYGMAHALLGVITRTIGDHYFTASVTEVALAPGELVLVLVIAPVVCVIAALAPAWDATRVLPREVLLHTPVVARWRRWSARGLGVGGLAIAAGSLLLAGVAGDGIVPAYAGLFAVMLGAACTMPVVCRLVAALARPICGTLLGGPGVHAARSAASSLSRTAVATAALMLAVSTTVGLGAMISSFRDTVDRWLQASLKADLFASPPSGIEERFRVRLAPVLQERIPALPGVEQVTAYRRFEVDGRIAGQDVGTLRAIAVEPLATIIDAYQPVTGPAGDIRAGALAGEGVLVSEPLANRLGLQRGTTISLRGPAGWFDLEVCGVFFDYASERGHLVLSQKLYARHLPPIGVSAFGLFTNPGVDPEALAGRIRQAGEGLQELGVQSRRGLLAASLEVFDRTFQITGALRLLCVIIAFLGIWSALASLQLDRQREIGALRALGATPRQVMAWITTQTGILGLAAGLWALPVGAALGWILVHVINQRSFGWTLLTFEVPYVVMGEALLLAVVAAVLAGLQPARRFATASITQALRED